MTSEEAIKLLSQIRDILLKSNSWLPSTHNPIKESFGMAINALTAQESNKLAINLQPCKQDDLISRQAVLDLIVASVNQFGGWYTTDMMNMWGLFTQVIKDMPSAEPEPEPVGCSGCRYERFGNRVCDVCSRFYADRYEAERRTDG